MLSSVVPRLLTVLALCAGPAAVAPEAWAAGSAPPDSWERAATLSALKGYEPPDAVVSPDGTVSVAWVRFGDVELAQRAPGEGWGPTQTAVYAGDAIDARLGVSGDGTLFLAWTEEPRVLGPTPYVVHERHSLPGGGWSRDTRVFRVAGVYVGGADYVVNAAGDAVLGVNTSDGRSETLSVLRRTSSTWSQPTEWQGVTAFDLALSDSGLAVASLTWQDRSTQRILVTRAAADGTWEEPSLLATIDRPLPYGSKTAPVAVDASDTATVAWRQGSDASGWRPYAAMAAAGQPWGTPVRLASSTGYAPLPVQLSTSADGHQLVVWSRPNGAVQAVRGDGAGGWSSPVTVAAAVLGSHLVGLTCGLDPGGAAAVAWTRAPRARARHGVGLDVSLMSAAGVWSAPQALLPTTARVQPGSLRVVLRGSDAVALWNHQYVPGVQSFYRVRTRAHLTS